jgi:excisionase family DNA binding protein
MNVTAVSTPKTLRTADWVAGRIGLSRTRVYALIRDHGLPSIHLGRAIRFDEDAVEDWLRHGGTAASPNGK